MNNMYDEFLSEYPAIDESHFATFALTILLFLAVVLPVTPDLDDQIRSLPMFSLSSSNQEKSHVPHELPQ